MKADFVNPFLLSLLNVLSTMAQLELKPGKPKRKMDELARGDVSGLIGMVGPQTRWLAFHQLREGAGAGDHASHAGGSPRHHQ